MLLIARCDVGNGAGGHFWRFRLKLVKRKGTKVAAHALLRDFGSQFVAWKLDSPEVSLRTFQVSPSRTKTHTKWPSSSLGALDLC